MASNRLYVCLFCVWDVGCATANQCSVLTSWPIVAFGSIPCSYASLPGKTTCVFSHFKSPCRSELPGDESCQKKCTPKFPGRVLYRKVSVHCTITAERQACEEQCLLLQFLGLFCHPWLNGRRQTMRQLEASHQQRTSSFKLCIMPMELLSGTSFGCNYRV